MHFVIQSLVGLQRGTGYFGASTRKKVSAILTAVAPIIPPSLAPASISEEQRQSLIAELKEKIKQFTIKLLELQLKLLQEQLRGSAYFMSLKITDLT